LPGIFECIGDSIMALVAMIAGCLECIIGSIAGFIATVVDCLTCGCCRYVLRINCFRWIFKTIAIRLEHDRAPGPMATLGWSWSDHDFELCCWTFNMYLYNRKEL
ncbi:hypothetical protein B0H34DRAFT_664855, partial [Crassisporium funariophilum]